MGEETKSGHNLQFFESSRLVSLPRLQRQSTDAITFRTIQICSISSAIRLSGYHVDRLSHQSRHRRQLTLPLDRPHGATAMLPGRTSAGLQALAKLTVPFLQSEWTMSDLFTPAFGCPEPTRATY